MNLDMIAELWEAVRPHIAGAYKETAEDFVAVLGENAINLAEFKEHTDDSYLKKAIIAYVDDEELEEEEDSDYDDMYFDEDDEYRWDD